MGRHVTSQIAFKSLAVGWVGGWGGSESDYNATLSSVSQSVRTSVAKIKKIMLQGDVFGPIECSVAVPE